MGHKTQNLPTVVDTANGEEDESTTDVLDALGELKGDVVSKSLVETLDKEPEEGDELGVVETDTLVEVRTESIEEMLTVVDSDEGGETFPEVENKLLDDVLVVFDVGKLLEVETEEMLEEEILVLCSVARKTIKFWLKNVSN